MLSCSFSLFLVLRVVFSNFARDRLFKGKISGMPVTTTLVQSEMSSRHTPAGREETKKNKMDVIIRPLGCFPDAAYVSGGKYKVKYEASVILR